MTDNYGDIQPGTFHNSRDENENIKPGTFHDEEELPQLDISIPSLGKSEVEGETEEAGPRPDLVAKYLLFKDTLNPKSDVVYYPCSAHDTSPSAAFPDSRVIYVDLDKTSIREIEKKGLEAHVASALEFNPGNVDILIILNPQIPPDVPCSFVVENGYVLSNNYHTTADKIHQNGDFKACGIIRYLEDGELTFDVDNIEECWREIETDEEFKNVPPSFGSVSYDVAFSIVRSITGKTENILEEYKKILAIARKEQDIKTEKFLREHPGASKNDIETKGVILFEYKGQQFVLNERIPKKKGTADDIFVFQRIKV